MYDRIDNSLCNSLYRQFVFNVHLRGLSTFSNVSVNT